MDIDLAEIDLTNIPPENIDEEISKLLKEEARHIFDLEQGRCSTLALSCGETKSMFFQ